MLNIFGIIIGLIVLTTLIVLHEYGHYRAAIRNGVKVNEFAIGFGPRIAAWLKNPEYIKWLEKQKTSKSKRQKDSTRPKKWLRLTKEEANQPHDTLVFTINWLPLGGYCAMDGESDADTRKGTFGAASFWGKTKILFAGVAMNWLTAIVILTILAWTGMPTFIDSQFDISADSKPKGHIDVFVTEVLENSPAAKAGFQVGDKLTYVKDETTNLPSYKPCISAESCSSEHDAVILSASDLIEFNTAHAGQTLNYSIQRGCNAGQECTSELQILTAKLNNSDAEYLLGIKMSETGQITSTHTWSAPIVGIGTTAQLTIETYKGIAGMVGNLVSGIARQFSPNDAVRADGRAAIGQAGDSVSGPIGIVGVIFPAFASAGLTNLAFLSALVSISLACMNVLPIPALDGGRWLLIAIARLRGKKLTKETEEKIVSRAFIVLLALFFLITVLDIIRLF